MSGIFPWGEDWDEGIRTQRAGSALVPPFSGAPTSTPAQTLTSARVSKKIAPHQAGAMRWRARYGDQLLCVRYRDDPAHGRRVVTVELLVDQRPLPSARPSLAETGETMKLRGDEPVAVLIQYDEANLRQRAKTFGGIWDPKARVWRLTRAQAAAAGLEHRIQGEEQAGMDMLKNRSMATRGYPGVDIRMHGWALMGACGNFAMRR